jgi:hypothetical protein
MTMVASDHLTESVDALQQSAATALSAGTAEEFESFEKQLNTLNTMVREAQQSMWAGEAEAAVERLEKGESLTETDRQVIRTFLVPDAEHYLAVENSYQDWIDELQRLIEDIAQRVENLDRHSIGELRGVLKDSIRLVPDIRNYLEEQQRVDRFNAALHNFDPASRATLVRVLREQLDRPHR